MSVTDSAAQIGFGVTKAATRREFYEMREPCHDCGPNPGGVDWGWHRHANGQHVIHCGVCNAWVYNAPKREFEQVEVVGMSNSKDGQLIARPCGDCGADIAVIHVVGGQNVIRCSELACQKYLGIASNDDLQTPEPQPKTILYRLYGGDGDLLYVGISDNWPSRMKQHKKDKHWFGEVERLDLQAFATRSEALLSERAAIESEKPKFNVVYNGQRPDRALPSINLHEALIGWVRSIREKLPIERRLAFNTEDAAAFLGFPPRVVRQLIKQGDLDVVRIGSLVRIPMRSIVGYVNKIADEVGE